VFKIYRNTDHASTDLKFLNKIFGNIVYEVEKQLHLNSF